MNVAQAPMCVMEGSAPTPPGALSVYVREGLLPARTARAASVSSGLDTTLFYRGITSVFPGA